MTEKIETITCIKNIAVFENFVWNIRDKGNNVVKFEDINIFYGRNYSGKTSLSRIFRALETGKISDKYKSPQFEVSLSNKNKINELSLTNHNHAIRVFNTDFIKDNLSFIFNENESINAFAILGENNIEIEKEIKQIEDKLGSENSSGLLSNRKIINDELKDLENALHKKEKSLNEKLTNKANNKNTGIKHNKLYGNANYNIKSLENDLKKVSEKDSLIDNKKEEYKKLLKEEAKKSINKLIPLRLKYRNIALKAERLISKEINPTEPIQDLLDNTTLADWVRHGQKLHENRKNCAFCNNTLAEDLFERLKNHFNKESEELRINLEQLLNEISTEQKNFKKENFFKLNKEMFYFEFHTEFNKIYEQLENILNNYAEQLNKITEQVKRRKEDIFKKISLEIRVQTNEMEQLFNDVINNFNILIDNFNKMTINLNEKQSEAKKKLLYSDLCEFKKDIDYDLANKEILEIKNNIEAKKNDEISLRKQIESEESNIRNLKLKLNDETKGVSQINFYLNSFFGHKYLSLEVISDQHENELPIYRFEIRRNEQKAYNLSEGECSLIAFCYFMAKLQDIDTKNKKPIIWIDDPICSLDSNHIFFVYSIIKSTITDNDQSYNQLFISTHNLEFLKYLKRLPKTKNSKKIKYFMIDRNENTSNIILMPNHLSKYATEFNFLFEQIYNCVHENVDHDTTYNLFYNFGNNARKFLELFLYYKYPDSRKNDEKLKTFFENNDKDKNIFNLINRVINEYSHLEGGLEKAMKPIDVPEMKKAAEFILNKIKENDNDQYNALLRSISKDHT